MNKKWLAVFVILAIALFLTSWLLPKDPLPQKKAQSAPAAAQQLASAAVPDRLGSRFAT